MVWVTFFKIHSHHLLEQYNKLSFLLHCYFFLFFSKDLLFEHHMFLVWTHITIEYSSWHTNEWLDNQHQQLKQDISKSQVIRSNIITLKYENIPSYSSLAVYLGFFFWINVGCIQGCVSGWCGMSAECLDVSMGGVLFQWFTTFSAGFPNNFLGK